MLEITEYSAELVKDPFGILSGKRYEFVLQLSIPEEDELHTESGVYVRVVYLVDEERSEIVKYELYERGTDRYLDFDLEDDEETEMAEFCKTHLPD